MSDVVQLAVLYIVIRVFSNNLNTKFFLNRKHFIGINTVSDHLQHTCNNVEYKIIQTDL